MYALPALLLLYLFTFGGRATLAGPLSTFQVDGEVSPDEIVALIHREFPQTKVTHLSSPGGSIATIAASLTQENKVAEAVAEEQKQQCIAKYAVKDYIPRHMALNPPPLLLSFPGSGNTWVRHSVCMLHFHI